MFEEPRLHRDQVLAPRRESYEKRPVLSATIYPDNKKNLVSISRRLSITVSQVTDEVLYTKLIEMFKLDAGLKRPRPFLHKVVSGISTRRVIMVWLNNLVLLV